MSIYLTWQVFNVGLEPHIIEHTIRMKFLPTIALLTAVPLAAAADAQTKLCMTQCAELKNLCKGGPLPNPGKEGEEFQCAISPIVCGYEYSCSVTRSECHHLRVSNPH